MADEYRTAAVIAVFLWKKRSIMARKIPTIDIEAEASAAGEVLDRRSVLRILSTAIREVNDRTAGERFRVREGDAERLAYYRLLIGLITTYNQVLAGAHVGRLDGLPAEPTAADRAFLSRIGDTSYF